MKKFKVSETYELVTEESAELGDFSETGFVFEDQYYTFRELVGLLTSGGYCHLSASYWHPRIWFSTEGSMDYQTGETETRQLHIDGLSEKYFRKLCAAANIKV